MKLFKKIGALIGRKSKLRHKPTVKEIRQQILNESLDSKLAEWISGKKFCEAVSHCEILDQFGVTSEELARYVKAKYGKTFLSWRKELRMKEASRLLVLEPDTSTCKIAEQVGIMDKSDFRKQFKDIFGCTPLEFRKNCLKNQ